MNLSYKKVGKGKNYILFLHELMGDCRNYEDSIKFFDKKEFTLIFIDLRGYGLSKNLKGEYSCREASKDVKNLVDTLKLETYTLLAHSMSTMIAQKIALIDKRVNKLILISPISASGIKMREEAKNSLIDDLAKDENKIEQIVEDASKRYNNSWREYRVEMAYSSSTLEARVGYMKMYLNTDFLKEAQENIKIPIKIIVGKDDFPVFTFNQVNKNFLNYKDVEIVQASQSGHYAMIETPIFFATQVEKWAKEEL